MCGIMGYVGDKSADRVIIDGLRRLEYRGYDSSGISVIKDKNFIIKRSVGKLVNLENILAKEKLTANIGIGHTRWATHGKPSENNAHPHVGKNKKIVIVHNGIIENYLEIKKKIKNCVCSSETDTEVLAHLIEDFYIKYSKDKYGDALLRAVQASVKHVVGSYALGVMCIDDPDTIIAARRSSPLIIGVGEHESFLASDVPAVLSYTNKVIILDDDETVVLKKNNITIYNKENKIIKKQIKKVDWDPVSAEKGGYKHFMLKEIFEQPEVISDTIRGRVSANAKSVFLDNVHLTDKDVSNINRIVFLACGTSYHAGLVGKFIFEELLGLPCDVEIGSEFRYRKYTLDKNCLVVPISQSGETADTLASFRYAKKSGAKNLVICNVVDSSLARDGDNVLYTRCGPEIGVASTKAFTGQLCALYLLALYLGHRKGKISTGKLQELVLELLKVPGLMRKTLKETHDVAEEWSKIFFKKTSFLYLGRNINYPIALEGALKLKEISYIHAEGYPAGEMKHGPIALIDENMPVLAIAVKSMIYEKIIANMSEAKARDGVLMAIATKGDKKILAETKYVCFIPKIEDVFSPMLTILPLQFLAYFIAKRRGCDVDQPRNLAKSVTVE